MLTWKIAMGDREAPLERVGEPSLRAIIDPIHDSVSRLLVGMDEDLTIILMVGDDRSLSLALRGDALAVNTARDLLGEQFAIGHALN